MEHNYKSLLGKIKEFAAIVDEFILENLTGRVQNLWESSKHYIVAGGKRLRPFLVLKSFNIVQNDGKKDKEDNNNNKDDKKMIPIASAVELLHTFTLIHDDIMDNDVKRRGVASVHTKWNEPLAILSGDLLYAMSFMLVSKSELTVKVKNKILHELGSVCIELCEGQAMDINFEERNDVTVEEYMQMIKLKTGALFKTCAFIGGLAGNATDSQLQNLKIYGEKLGKSFQIADDILGLTSLQDKLGKPVGNDIREGKKTYLLLNALENLNQNDTKILKEIILKTRKTEEEVIMAIKLIKKSGSLEKAKKIAKTFADEAINAIQIFGDSEEKTDLKNLAYLAVDRNF
ncbi:MAG: polyprenyl synthetase family protein [Promethearchaeota archaeon]